MGRTAGALNKPKIINQKEQPKLTDTFKEVENEKMSGEKMYVRDGKRFSEKERKTFVELVAQLKKLTSPSELKDKFNKVADLYMDEVMDIETALTVLKKALEQHSKDNVTQLESLKSELDRPKGTESNE